MVVDRFFTTSNYSEVECKKVLDLLLTSKEPLTSFSSIKDTELQEVIIDNEGNLPAWQSARKAISAIGLSEATKKALEAMAADGNLARVKRVAVKAGEVRAATSKTLDVIVTSAVALSASQRTAVEKSLPQYVGGSAVKADFKVDPAVLGGLLVTFRNQAIDLTATTRLMEVASAQKMA